MNPYINEYYSSQIRTVRQDSLETNVNIVQQASLKTKKRKKRANKDELAARKGKNEDEEEDAN